MTNEEILEIATQCGVWVPMGSDAGSKIERENLIDFARRIESNLSEIYN
jgi:hypothetical protein